MTSSLEKSGGCNEAQSLFERICSAKGRSVDIFVNFLQLALYTHKMCNAHLCAADFS